MVSLARAYARYDSPHFFDPSDKECYTEEKLIQRAPSDYELKQQLLSYEDVHVLRDRIYASDRGGPIPAFVSTNFVELGILELEMGAPLMLENLEVNRIGLRAVQRYFAIAAEDPSRLFVCPSATIKCAVRVLSQLCASRELVLTALNVVLLTIDITDSPSFGEWPGRSIRAFIRAGLLNATAVQLHRFIEDQEVVLRVVRIGTLAGRVCSQDSFDKVKWLVRVGQGQREEDSQRRIACNMCTAIMAHPRRYRKLLFEGFNWEEPGTNFAEEDAPMDECSDRDLEIYRRFRYQTSTDELQSAYQGQYYRTVPQYVSQMNTDVPEMTTSDKEYAACCQEYWAQHAQAQAQAQAAAWEAYIPTQQILPQPAYLY